VLKFHMGHGDATIAFREFHARSQKPRKLLATLQSRPAPEAAVQESIDGQERRTKLTAEFMNFRQRLEKEGWFHPDYLHVAYRVTELLMMPCRCGLTPERIQYSCPQHPGTGAGSLRVVDARRRTP